MQIKDKVVVVTGAASGIGNHFVSASHRKVPKLLLSLTSILKALTLQYAISMRKQKC